MWPTVKLGEVLRLDLDKVAVDPSVSYPMVGILSFGKGLFEREPIRDGQTSYKTFYRLKAEHVVMSQLFGWEGALALSSDRFAGKFVSPQFPTFVCDPSKLDRDFLGWFIKRSSFWDDLGSRASGMGDRRRTLSPEALFACGIPLPSIAEQKGIVGRISELFASVEAVRDLRKAVKKETEALCRSVLFDDSVSHVSTPMQQLVKLREPDVTVSPEADYEFAGVYSFGGGLFRGQRKSGMEFSYSKLSRLRAGNFVYPKLMAWEGALGVVPESLEGLHVSPEFPVFEVDRQRVLPETLDVYFRTPSVWPHLASISAGTNVRRRRLHPSAFLLFEFPLPPMETQLQLRRILSDVAVVSSMRMESDIQLESLMPSILDKAFRGELSPS